MVAGPRSSASDQRQHQRYPIEVAAEVAIAGDVTVASTQNISSGGVGLVIERPVEEGGKVDVTLFLTQDGIEDPDEEPFEATATVMWAAEREPGTWMCGVRFDRIDEAQRKQLERFLAVSES